MGAAGAGAMLTYFRFGANSIGNELFRPSGMHGPSCGWLAGLVASRFSDRCIVGSFIVRGGWIYRALGQPFKYLATRSNVVKSCLVGLAIPFDSSHAVRDRSGRSWLKYIKRAPAR